MQVVFNQITTNTNQVLFQTHELDNTRLGAISQWIHWNEIDFDFLIILLLRQQTSIFLKMSANHKSLDCPDFSLSRVYLWSWTTTVWTAQSDKEQISKIQLDRLKNKENPNWGHLTIFHFFRHHFGFKNESWYWSLTYSLQSMPSLTRPHKYSITCLWAMPKLVHVAWLDTDAGLSVGVLITKDMFLSLMLSWPSTLLH